MNFKLNRLSSLLLTNRSAIRPIPVIFSHGKKTKNDDEMLKRNTSWIELVKSYEKENNFNPKKKSFKSKARVNTAETNKSVANDTVNQEVQRDWFTKLTKNPITETNTQLKQKTVREQLAECKTPEEKKALIETFMVLLICPDLLEIPQNLTDDEWKDLLVAESFSQLKQFLIKIAKNRHYAEEKALKREETLKRKEKMQVQIDAGLISIQENHKIHRRIAMKDIRFRGRNNLASAIMNDSPSLVFDFRYEHYFNRPNLIPSLYRQYIDIISKNRQAVNPFQLHFCNYRPDNVFNLKYRQFMDMDKNLILETSKCYKEIFPKENLVYLSKDAKKTLYKFDPEKVYIIGNIIDSGNDLDRYASYIQANKDGIQCQRLPIDEYIKWQSGSKNLAMHHVFRIMLQIANGCSWEDAFKSILPSRFTGNNSGDAHKEPIRIKQKYAKTEFTAESRVQRLRIQPDWNDFFKYSNVRQETLWVQYKSSESPAINSKILIESESTPILTDYDKEKMGVNPDFQIEYISKENNSIHLSYKHQSNTITTFVAPISQYAPHFDEKTQQRTPVYGIDVTDNGLGVSSSTEGSLLVWTQSNGEVRRNLSGHISDVNTAKFFPSGIVVLSGGADLRVKIWSVENGKSPVQLGHLSGVMDVCIVDKGRNIVTACRDGTCRLWDLGQSKCLALFGQFDCIINACDIEALSEEKLKTLPMSDEVLSEREIGTENKLVACACEDGFLRVIALRSRVNIFEFQCDSAVNCCCFLNETQVACGTHNGFIYILDIENITNPVVDSWREFRSSVLSVQKFIPTGGLIISTADGSCFVINLSDKTKVIELTGPDMDHVYKTSHNQSHVYTCCRDGFIRKYDLNHILNSLKD